LNFNNHINLIVISLFIGLSSIFEGFDLPYLPSLFDSFILNLCIFDIIVCLISAYIITTKILNFKYSIISKIMIIIIIIFYIFLILFDGNYYYSDKFLFNKMKEKKENYLKIPVFLSNDIYYWF
jgi:hypothetical protein